MMFRAIYITLFCCFLADFIIAQDKAALSMDEGTNLNVLYRNEGSVQVYANTRGFGGLYRRGRHVTAKTRSFWEIDFQSLKHPKEIKIQRFRPG